MEDSLLLFWGKAQPSHEQSPPTHCLAYHALDVAAVGTVLLSKHPGIEAATARFFPAPVTETRQWIAFLLAIHDLGKFAKKFQAKAPSCFPREIFKSADLASIITTFDHGSAGYDLLVAQWASFDVPGDLNAWMPLLSAVTGHHGSPPKLDVRGNRRTLRANFGCEGIAHAHSFVERMTSLFALQGEAPPLPTQNNAHAASYFLAGLAVLADWIGSNQSWFPYHAPGLTLEEYWRKAVTWADAAIEKAEILPAPVSESTTYASLIGSGATPTPMQRWAESCIIPDGPTLFMVEDETGSGKTEAAIMLAHRLMVEGRADGMYVALPTMATANGMFERLSAAYRHLFKEGASPSVALSHSARDMNPGFRRRILPAGREEAPYGEDAAQDTTASASCAAWIADDRRRAFLADLGAGTVDQAILGVLPSRHQSLRLLGLMRKVLILDEIHAYDAYMQREIEGLLEFQAALGGDVILLSATLPGRTRERLGAAYLRRTASRSRTAPPEAKPDYPLASIFSGQHNGATPIEGAPGRGRSVPVRFLRRPEEGIAKVLEAAGKGQSVVYMRNTVDDAMDAYRSIVAQHDPERVTLFHSRFALTDRLAIERRVMDIFGKHGEPSTREGQVLVATQVVEQSLDLDFDALVSDLAPIDLLIQRAGRLWRHKHRSAEWRLGNLELYVVGPEATGDADLDWYRTTFPRAAFVYRNTAVLWRTACALKKAGAIRSPGSLRGLIEYAYSNEPDGLPQPLHECMWDAEGQEIGERGIAAREVLSLDRGYLWDGGAWDHDHRTLTRLNDDPQNTLRLAVVNDSGEIQPYATAEDPQTAWRLSEVSVSKRNISGEDIPADLLVRAEALKAGWRKYDDQILVVLDRQAPGVHEGHALSGRDEGHSAVVHYDRQAGLKVLAL